MGRRPGRSFSRAELLAAAVALVEEQGAAALKVRSLAQRVGVVPSTIYHHIDGIEALRHGVATEGWRRMAEEVEALEGAPEEVLRYAAHHLRAFALAHPHLYQVMSSVRFDPADPELLAATAQGMRTLATLGFDDPVEMVHAIRSLRAGVHGFVLNEIAGQYQLAIDADDTFAWWVDVVMAGLRAKGLLRERPAPI